MSRYWKFIIASLAPVLLVLEEVRQEVDRSGDQLTTDDIWRIALSALIALGVYAKSNTPPPGAARAPGVSETAR